MKDSVITKLESLQERYEEVQALLGQPEVVADQERFKALSKEFASLTDVVKGFQSYKEAQSNYDGIIEMLNSDDAELRAMAEEEQDEAKANLEKVEHDIQILLLPKDPKDDNDCFLEIRAGTGGDEAAIFAPLFLPEICSACITTMPKKEAGRWKLSAAVKVNTAVTRK